MQNLKAMRAFVEVARCGSFAAAARQLSLSTSSVSRLVSDLEAWLREPLIRRTTRNLSLTDAGGRYLERCRDIIAAWDSLARDARAATDVPRGRLHVAGAAYPVQKLLTPVLPDFQALFPQVQLELHLQDQPVDLIDEGIDIAMRIGRLEDSTLISRRIGDMYLKLTASPAFLSEHGTPKALADLAALPCLIDTTVRDGHRWSVGRVINVDGPIAANDGEVIRRMTLAGLGISLLPDFFVDADIRSGSLVHLFPGEPMEPIGIYTLLPARGQITPAARAFADFVAGRLPRS